MKKHKILFVLLTTLFINGCIYHEERGNATDKGKLIYDAWSNATDEILNSYVDVAYRFNTWYLTSEQEKDHVKKTLLSQYSITTIDESHWELRKGKCTFQFYVFQPLTEVGAKWSVGITNDSISEEEGLLYGNPESGTGMKFTSLKKRNVLMKINAIGNNKWDVEMRCRGNDGSYSHTGVVLTIEAINSEIPKSIVHTDFVLSGRGQFSFEKYPSIAWVTYDISEGMKYETKNRRGIQNHYIWSTGKLFMQVDGSSNLAVDIGASFAELSSGKYGVYITYRGVTELW